MFSKICKAVGECVFPFFRKKTVLFCLIYVLFYSFWEDIIGRTFVDIFFSHFETNIISDVIFLLLSVGFIVKSFQSKSKQKEKILAGIIALAFWCYYRFCSERFIFFSLATIEEVKYIDIVAVYGICKFINYVWNIHKPKFLFNDGFDRDTPIENENEDLFGRNELAKDAVKKLLNTDTSADAFSFGIVSPWGAGKTSFMNLMKKNIKKEYEECIVIDFNPWMYSNKADIITLFLDELSKNLRKYDSGLASEILEYSKALSSIETAETKIVSVIVDIMTTPSKLDDRISMIKESIKSVGKKIVVFVDDIDRLDSTEIMEVLKLIRNISNFPLMYFVVAYDKDYILDCLKEKMPTRESNYTEKIFQIEFPLPQFEKKIIKDSIYKSISKFVAEEEKKEFSDYIYVNNSWGEGNTIVEENISTIRDVKRIVNSFRVSYSRLKGEIKVCDLFVLEVLKTKYPIVYSIFERDKQYVLKRNRNNCYELYDDESDQQRNFYSYFEDKDKYSFKRYLKENYTQLHINESDEKKIKNILSRLFPSYVDNASEKSINNFFYTNRYFSVTILESDISELEFDEVIQKDMDSIKIIFAKWSKNKSNALSAKLKQFKPKDKEEHKKYIRILLYSTSIIPSDPYFITNQIRELGKFNKNNQISDEDKLFIKDSLCENGYSEGLAVYLYSIIYDGDIYNFPLSQNDLKDVRIRIFYDCIKYKDNDDIRVVLNGYQYTKEVYWDDGMQKAQAIPENKELMKSYAISHLLDFIKCTIIRDSSDTYHINKWLPTHLWDSWENFVSYIENIEEKSPAIKEYIEFIEKCKGRAEIDPVSFTFEHIHL